jgi:hypothetical protein
MHFKKEEKLGIFFSFHFSKIFSKRFWKWYRDAAVNPYQMYREL